MNTIELACLDRLIAIALAEDLGDLGDITSQLTIPANHRGKAAFVARVDGVLAGLEAARRVAATVDPSLVFQRVAADGQPLKKGDTIATFEGPMRSLLTAERTALNFLQRLSGIASLTRQYVDAVAGLPVALLDTRKTTPGWRHLEKYAVRMGGGTNHRIGLFDAILVKDNHLAALAHTPRGLWPELAERVAAMKKDFPHLPITVEVDSLAQLERVLPMGPKTVLLDNMDAMKLAESVAIRNRLAPKGVARSFGRSEPANRARDRRNGRRPDQRRGVDAFGQGVGHRVRLHGLNGKLFDVSAIGDG